MKFYPIKSLLIPFLIAIIFIIGLLYILFYKDKMFLNEREVNVEVLDNGSIKVEELWDIERTSTLRRTCFYECE